MFRLSFIILLFCGLNLHAQENSSKRIMLNEKSIVKDSTGYQYPYIVWTKLFQSGNYGLKPKKAEGIEPEFVMYELSEEEKTKQMESLPKPGETSFFTTGSKLKNFKFTDIKGNKYNLEELAGKVVVLNFWFINCPPCRMEIPELNKMVLSYKDNPNVVFLAIGLDEKYEIEEFLKRSPFIYNITAQGKWLAYKYGVQSFPTHVVADQTGKVIFHTTGLAMNTVYWVNKSINTALQSSKAENSGN
ncbi:MAG: TlpA disulfide reductase family protein [Daejeonella sp.]